MMPWMERTFMAVSEPRTPQCQRVGCDLPVASSDIHGITAWRCPRCRRMYIQIPLDIEPVEEAHAFVLRYGLHLPAKVAKR